MTGHCTWQQKVGHAARDARLDIDERTQITQKERIDTDCRGTLSTNHRVFHGNITTTLYESIDSVES